MTAYHHFYADLLFYFLSNFDMSNFLKIKRNDIFRYTVYIYIYIWAKNAPGYCFWPKFCWSAWYQENISLFSWMMGCVIHWIMSEMLSNTISGKIQYIDSNSAYFKCIQLFYGFIVWLSEKTRALMFIRKFHLIFTVISQQYVISRCCCSYCKCSLTRRYWWQEINR